MDSSFPAGTRSELLEELQQMSEVLQHSETNIIKMVHEYAHVSQHPLPKDPHLDKLRV